MIRKLMFVFYVSTVLGFSIPVFAGEADLAYFKQFLYQKEVDNSDPDFTREQYRVLMTRLTEYQYNDGSKVTVNAALYLQENGSYDLFYRESLLMGERNPDGSQPMAPQGCKHFKGNWSVPSTDLVLNEGVGTPAFIDNQHAVQMVFSQDIILSGLKGRPILFMYGYSMSPMEMDAKFCF